MGGCYHVSCFLGDGDHGVVDFLEVEVCHCEWVLLFNAQIAVQAFEKEVVVELYSCGVEKSRASK